jgi:ATP-dependent Clp protease ATP-binding subunit ClpC
VLTLLASDPAEKVYERRWLRRVTTTRPATAAELGSLPAPGTEQAVLSATPAADATLSGAARLAGSQPVGSHHLLLASLADPRTAAARALAALGLNLEHAREALLDMDVTGTSDELPEDAGRRRMRIRVIGDQLRLEADDPVLVQAGRDAIAALGDEEKETGTIRGQLPVSASLSRVWQALLESLADIQRRAALPAEPPAKPSAEPSAKPSAESSAEPSNAPLPGPAGESPAGPDTPDS